MRSDWIPVDVDELRKSTIRGDSSAMVNDVPIEFQIELTEKTAALFFNYVVNSEPVHQMVLNPITTVCLGRHSQRLYSLEVRYEGGPRQAAAALREGMLTLVQATRDRDRYRQRVDNFNMAKSLAKDKAAATVESMAH